MDNNIKLPDNFSNKVMASINLEIAAREKREEQIMYLSIIGVGSILLGVLIYMAYSYGWFLNIKEQLNFVDIERSFANTATNVVNSFSPIWTIVFINAIILIGLYSYFTQMQERKFKN
ncbi:MAG: hypothetical protein RSC28_00565 [Bacteroidales bacterium]